MIMRTRLFTYAPLLLLAVITPGCDPGSGNFTVDAADVCRCGRDADGSCDELSRNWELTENDLMGVSAFDFENGGFVGTACQGEAALAWEPWPFYFNSWRPVTGFKENMVGTLHEFNWNINDDEDWNLHVVPDDPFTFLITDVEALHSEAADKHDRCGGPACMEMEISPDKQFWSNPWFFKPGQHPSDAGGNGSSWLEGRKMGYYGIWLMDANHDFKSEIHPANQMWFTDHFENGFGSNGPFDIFWLFFMQDNTGRFDDEDNFDCGGLIGDNIPAGWKPWENGPRSGQFNIAFEVNPANEVVTFSINEIFKRNVVTGADAAASSDADDGTTHVLEFEGREVVRVSEEQSEDNDLGVTFTNLCQLANGRLRGFVTLKSKIGGNDDRDEEGFHILYVTRSINATGPARPRPPVADLLYPATLRVRGNEGSLTTGPTGFGADFTVELVGDSAASAEDLRVVTVELEQGGKASPVRHAPGPKGKGILVSAVPLVQGSRIRVTTGSGRVLSADVPGIALAPVLAEAPRMADPIDGAWSAWSKAVGAGPAKQPGTAKANVNYETGLRLLPVYSGRRGSGKRMDIDPVHVAELNTAIRTNARKTLLDVMGSEAPFTINWEFEAKDVLTGEVVPVHLDDRPHPDGIQVRKAKSMFENDSVLVRYLGPPARMVACTVRATIVDTEGLSQTVERTFHSHDIAGFKDLPQAAAWLAAMAGLDEATARSLAATPGPKTGPDLTMDAKTRRTLMVRAALAAALRDGRITMVEYKSLMNGAQLLR